LAGEDFENAAEGGAAFVIPAFFFEVVEEDGAVDGVVGGDAFFFEAGEDAVLEVSEFEFAELELAGGEAAGGGCVGVNAEDAFDVGLGAFPVELDVGVGVGDRSLMFTT